MEEAEKAMATVLAEGVQNIVDEVCDSKKEKKPALSLKNGMVAPESVEQQYRLADLYLKSKVLPERFKTREQIVAALHFVSEHFPDSPLTALRQVAVINGVPSFYGDLPLAIVLKTGKLTYKKEFWIDKDGKEINLENGNLQSEVWGAVCVTKRYDMENHTTHFTVDDAKRAGLWERGVWKNYPKRMLKMRARSENLKDNFADCLNGVGISEFDFNEDPAVRDVSEPNKGFIASNFSSQSNGSDFPELDKLTDRARPNPTRTLEEK